MIFAEYKKAKENQKDINRLKRSKMIENGIGISHYFNEALPVMLLYKNERKQYNDWDQKNPDIDHSYVYGFIHLLRLFTRLGYIFSFTPWSDNSIVHLKEQIEDFLGFMQENKDKFYNVDKDYI